MFCFDHNFRFASKYPARKVGVARSPRPFDSFRWLQTTECPVLELFAQEADDVVGLDHADHAALSVNYR